MTNELNVSDTESSTSEDTQPPPEEALQPEVTLTADDIKHMTQPLTVADWIRILRSTCEELEKRRDPVALNVCSSLLQAILNDVGYARNMREQLTGELTSCTPGELSLLTDALKAVRSVHG